MFSNPGDEVVRTLLEGARRIVVVGLSPKPHRDSHRIAQYLTGRGYEVIPVYPRGDEILGSKVYRRVQDVPGQVDVVDVFRRSEHLAAVVDELLDMSDRIRQMILERLPVAEIKQAAREEGMTFLRESALEKVFAGVTTLREINKVTFVQ